MATTQGKRWNPAGTAAAEFCAWTPQRLKDMESSLCLQQYLQQLISQDPSAMLKILRVPPKTEEVVWQYEHLRQLALQANHLIAMLGDCCTPEVCPEMEAQNQKFLCAAHNPPGECCAMDYMIHTVEKLTSFLNNPTHFPGRMDVPAKSAEQFPSAARRLYRLFLHAYFRHRDEFEQFEQATCLCQRFTCYALKFKFLDADSLVVPVPMEEALWKEPDRDDSSDKSEGEEEAQTTSSEDQ